MPHKVPPITTPTIDTSALMLTLFPTILGTIILLSMNWTTTLRIITPNINVKVLGLSGGNQQKVVLARWLAKKVKVLILDEPTHGIDVGAKVEIYQLLGELTKEGIGIILISSEFQELIAITDRILVMYRGSIKKEFNTKNTNQEELLKCAFGLNATEKDKL